MPAPMAIPHGAPAGGPVAPAPLVVANNAPQVHTVRDDATVFPAPPQPDDTTGNDVAAPENMNPVFEEEDDESQHDEESQEVDMTDLAAAFTIVNN